MPRFFVNPDDIHGDTVLLTGENAHHASYSLRLAVGDTVTVCDQTLTYTCKLTHFDANGVEARILSSRASDTEPPYRAILFQALPKGDKLDTVIQKAVELGVSEIVPFESEHCIMKSKPDAEPRKTERRRKIAEEAAKQSGRGVIPTVRPTVCDYRAVIAEAAACSLALFCYEGEGTVPLDTLISGASDWLSASPAPTVAIVIGSEGGFSPEEAQAAADAGCRMTGLGPRILRTETASGFVLSCLAFAAGL